MWYSSNSVSTSRSSTVRITTCSQLDPAACAAASLLGTPRILASHRCSYRRFEYRSGSVVRVREIGVESYSHDAGSSAVPRSGVRVTRRHGAQWLSRSGARWLLGAAGTWNHHQTSVIIASDQVHVAAP